MFNDGFSSLIVLYTTFRREGIRTSLDTCVELKSSFQSAMCSRTVIIKIKREYFILNLTMMQEASKRRCNKIKLLSLSFVSKLISQKILIKHTKFASLYYLYFKNILQPNFGILLLLKGSFT